MSNCTFYKHSGTFVRILLCIEQNVLINLKTNSLALVTVNKVFCIALNTFVTIFEYYCSRLSVFLATVYKWVFMSVLLSGNPWTVPAGVSCVGSSLS